MSVRFFYYFSFILLFFPLCSFAQLEKINEEWRWTRFDQETGLPSDQVLTIIETTDGTPWVATSAGLAWFDSFRWHAVGTAQGIPAKKASYMIAGVDNEVYAVIDYKLFCGTINGFVHIPIIIKSDTIGIHAVVPIRKKEFYFQTSIPGLFLYHNQKTEIFPTPFRVAHNEAILFQTRSNLVWVSSASGLFYLENGSWKKRLPVELALKVVENIKGDGFAAVEWGPADRGLWDWRKDGRIIISPRKENLFVQAMDISDAGDAIVAFSSSETRIRRDYRWEKVQIPILNKNFTNAFQFRQNGDLWVCSDNGLYLFQSSLKRWNNFNAYSPIAANFVNEIYRSKKGSIWSGISGGLLVQHSDRRMEIINRIGSQTISDITAVSEDESGNIWIGSGSAFPGVYRWDGKQWEYFGIEKGFSAAQIHRIVKDRKGRLWFLGISSAGLIEQSSMNAGAILLEKGKFYPWGLADGLLHTRVYSFCETEDGAFWFGTLVGLCRLKNNKWTYWTIKTGLNPARIWTMVPKDSSTVWFSSRNSTLQFIDKNDSARSLPIGISKDIYELKKDERGRLWVSTRGMLLLIDRDVISHFAVNTGLINPRLWPILPVDSSVYVGTFGSGITALKFDEQSDPPPVVEFSESIVLHQGNTVSWKVFPFWGKVSPDVIESRYKIDDGLWSHWSTRKNIENEDVSGGRHNITVQAKGLFGQYDSTGTSCSFTIPVPFYQHPGFFFPILFLSGALSILLFNQWKKRQEYFQLLEANVKRRTMQLEESLKQKDALLKEVHHRVKNNLQIVMSFLDLQQQHIKDPEAEKMMDESQRRIEAIFLVHQLLYQSENLTTIDFKKYLQMLLPQLEMAYKPEGLLITIAGKYESITFNIDQAITAGLIVTELVANALKHAFPDRHEGKIFIELKRIDSGSAQLSVFDDGVGISLPFKIDRNDSVGMQLIQLFVRKMNGSIEYLHKDGSLFLFTFPLTS